MGLFKKKFGDDINLDKILRALIYTDLYHNYAISIYEFDANVDYSEYVRLLLHYYAKMLFNFDPSVESDVKFALLLKNNNG